MQSDPIIKMALTHLDEALALLDAHDCGRMAALHICHAVDMLRAEDGAKEEAGRLRSFSELGQ